MAASAGSKRYIGLLIVLALALLSWWFQRQEQKQESTQRREAHVVDYSMTDFEATAMDDAGRPRHHLQAPLMRHFADDDSAELQQPQLLLYRTTTTDAGDAAEERWHLQAEMAQLYHGGAEMLLQGHVEMRRFDAADKVTLTLETRDLWVYTDQKRAESAEEVEIREERGVTRARGVKIDLNKGQLELLAAVRGKYVLEQ